MEDYAIEFSFSAFEDGELCVFGFGHFIRLPATWVNSKLCAEVPFHVNLHIFVSKNLGENVSADRNVLAENLSADRYLNKIRGSTLSDRVLSGF